MRAEYDFTHAERTPYAKSAKTTVTIRLDQSTVAYFKALAQESGMPYQRLINLYLADCAARGLKPVTTWLQALSPPAQLR